jgi:hypothetical protein
LPSHVETVSMKPEVETSDAGEQRTNRQHVTSPTQR